MEALRADLWRDTDATRREADALERLGRLAGIFIEHAVPAPVPTAPRDVALEADEFLYFFTPARIGRAVGRLDGRFSPWMTAVGQALTVLDGNREELCERYASAVFIRCCSLVPHTAALELACARPWNRAKHVETARHFVRGVYEATRDWPTD